MNTDLKLKAIPIAIASAIGLSATAPVFAQGDAVTLEEIVVTARKVEESIQDVPLSITAFTANDISKRSIEELDDVALYTPGLSFEDYSNGGFATPIIRGASQFSVDQLEQNVSTFINGVYIPRGYAIDLGSIDMERIEVVKGPQSALYGANAFMGAINYVTSKANLEEFNANVGAVIGGDGRQDISGTVSIPIVPEKLAVKLAGKITEYDGDWANDHPAALAGISPGTDDTFGGWDNESFEVSVLAQPTDALSIEFSYNTFDILTEGRAQTRLEAASGDLNCGNLFFFNPLNPKVYCGELPSTPLLPGTTTETGFAIDPRTYGMDSQTDVMRAAFSANLTDELTLSYQFANIDGDVFSAGSSDRDPVAGTFDARTTGEVRNFFTVLPAGGFDYDSHELRLEFTGDNGLYAMVGAFLSDGTDLDDGDAGYEGILWNLPGGTTAITESSVDPAIFIANGAITVTESESIFARISLPLMDEKLVLAAEGRYTDESKTGSDSTGDYLFEDSYFTPRISVDYHLTDDRLLYASIANGVKSGGINGAVLRNAFFQLLPLPDDERFYGRDENTTFEIGTKNTLMDGRLQLNAAAYLIDWSDLQVSVAADGATAFTANIISNLGSAESKGVELEMVFAVTNALTLNAGLALNDASYDSGTISQRIVRAGLCPADNSICNANGDIGGNSLPRSSDTQWNIGAQYDGSFGGDFDYFLRADVTGQSEQFVGEINTATIPSRTITNLRAGLSKNKWSAELWIKNATDEQYVSNAFYIPNPFFVTYVPTYGNLRRLGLTLNYDF